MGLILGAIGAIVTAAVTVSKALAVVGLAVQGIKAIGNAIVSIAKALGIIKPERDIEEVGDRALQAEEKGITPDKFSSYEAWVKKIEDDDWGYDPEKNKDMDSQKKILKGVEVSTAVTMERFPNLPIKEFFTLAGNQNNAGFFTPERWEEIGKVANENPEVFGDIVKYVTGSSREHSVVESASDALMAIEKTLDSGLSEDLAYDKVATYQSMK